jgi:hypothetical protein
MDLTVVNDLESDPLIATPAARRRWDKLTPRAGVRVQMFSAALLWLAGTSFLLVRGVLFIEAPGPRFHFGYAIVPIALVAVALGIVKARYILVRYADRAVARIRGRGRACYFGFFAPSSWLFVVVMMGGGILLRHSALVDHAWGRVFLATLYIAVGTGLAIADRIFWVAALHTRAAMPEASPFGE